MEEPFNSDLRIKTPDDLLEEEASAYRSQQEGSNRSSVSSGFLNSLPVFQVSVTDPVKIGEAINSYVVYTVKVKTECAEYKRAETSVQRRYSDFLALYNELSHSHPGVFIPPIPEKHAIGRFQEDFVETRRLALQKCLIKMTSHPKLYRDQQLINFLSDDHYSPPVVRKQPVQPAVSSADMANPSGGNSGRFLGVFRAVGEALASLTASKVGETDEWFESKRVQVEGIEGLFRTLYKCIEAMSKHRRELAVLSSEFGDNLISISNIELNKSLAGSLVQVGELHQRAKGLHEKQAKHDSFYLLSIVDEFTRILGSIKQALATRLRYANVWAQDQAALSKAKETLQKARLAAAKNITSPASNSSKIAGLEEEVKTAEKKVFDSATSFKEISQTIREEMDFFDREKLIDFQCTVKDYLGAMIETQKEIIHLWESFKPEPTATTTNLVKSNSDLMIDN